MAYQGLIAEIPLGVGGLNGSKNQSQIPPEQMILTRNIDLSRGTVTKMGGAAKYNSVAITGAPSVLGGWDWWPIVGTQRMMVLLSDGSYKRDDGAGTFGTTLTSGLLTGGIPVFVEAGKEVAANNRKLFLFSYVNQVQVVSGDGAVANNIGVNKPADWTAPNYPAFGFVHEGRLWGGGNANDPHRLYYSTTGDHENFTGAGSGSISLFPGEGEKLIAATSYKGLIVAWKFPVGIYLIDTSDPTPANWRVSRLTGGIVGVSPLAFFLIHNDIVFLDAAGNFQLLSAVQEFGDAATSSLSQRDQINVFLRESVNFGQFSQTMAIYYPAKREAAFLFAPGTDSNLSARMVIDFNRPDGPRFHFQDRDANRAIWLRKDTNSIARPMIGDYSGFVWHLDQAAKTRDGSAYTSEFQTPHLDFSWLDPKLGTRRKNGQFLELVTEPTGNWNISVDIIWDGVVAQTVSFNMGSSGASLGSFILDTDTLGGDAVLNRKRRIVGSGRRLSLAVRNAGSGEDFSLIRFYLHFTLGDERLD